MPIQVTCTKCGATYSVPDSRAGQTGRCKCGETMIVPGLPTAPPAPAPPTTVPAPPPPPLDAYLPPEDALLEQEELQGGGQVQCPHCHMASRQGPTCEWCSQPLAPTAPTLPPPPPMPYAGPGTPPPPYASPAVPPPPMLRTRPALPEFAGFWRRFAAAFIDGILLDVVMVPLSFLAGMGANLRPGFGSGATSPHPVAMGAALAIDAFGLALWWLYHALMESSQYQATLGKMALEIVVTDLNGERLGFGQATGRTFGKIVSSLICSVGYIMAGFTERKQALHDMMASCVVVVKPR